MATLQLAPVFAPTAEELASPLKYFDELAPFSVQSGIVKVILPEGTSNVTLESVTAHLRAREARIWTRRQQICEQQWPTLAAAHGRFSWVPHARPLRDFHKLASKRLDDALQHGVDPSAEAVEVCACANCLPRSPSLASQVSCTGAGRVQTCAMSASRASAFRHGLWLMGHRQ